MFVQTCSQPKSSFRSRGPNPRVAGPCQRPWLSRKEGQLADIEPKTSARLRFLFLAKLSCQNKMARPPSESWRKETPIPPQSYTQRPDLWILTSGSNESRSTPGPKVKPRLFLCKKKRLSQKNGQKEDPSKDQKLVLTGGLFLFHQPEMDQVSKMPHSVCDLKPCCPLDRSPEVLRGTHIRILGAV